MYVNLDWIKKRVGGTEILVGLPGPRRSGASRSTKSSSGSTSKPLVSRASVVIVKLNISSLYTLVVTPIELAGIGRLFLRSTPYFSNASQGHPCQPLPKRRCSVLGRTRC